jgi:division protein CdvB (Snf7/Vps24/ESCRT-III family)
MTIRIDNHPAHIPSPQSTHNINHNTTSITPTIDTMSTDLEQLSHRLKTADDMQVDPTAASESSTLYDEDEKQLVPTRNR